jgi:hypothetical protein
MIFVSSTLQPNAFQEFHPKAGSFPYCQFSTVDTLHDEEGTLPHHLSKPTHLRQEALLTL